MAKKQKKNFKYYKKTVKGTFCKEICKKRRDIFLSLPF